MTRSTLDDNEPDARASRANALTTAATLRGLLVAYGIGAYSLMRLHLSPVAPVELVLFFHDLQTLILVGLGIQAIRWVALRTVAAYEKEHGLEGVLSPNVMSIVDLVIDGVTVLLFALATFRSIMNAAIPM